MDGVSFERVVADLLRSRGFHRIKLTEHYDFGIDIIAERGGIRWGVQVKRHTRLVKLSAVSQAVAALAHYNCDRAMVITNGRFSASARTLAASNNCLLIDGPHLRYWARLRNT
jgi:restriction system protein